MIPELGHFALILALAFALVQGVLPMVGASTGNATLIALAKPAARAQFLFIALAYAALTNAFVANDFSVLYVAQHSNSALPLVYRYTAVWGGHEGSILLWVLILAGWTFAVTLFSKQLDDRTVARILGVMGLISTGFLLFTLLTSNPFVRLLPAAPDGEDLTPLLQDPGMVIHPPMLYMGYVGFVVAFAFAIAALLSGRLDAAWARWSRPWTTVAWCFLTCGIALGSFWAYYELGWGGWWFWDPVENASLMPWLAGTALMHSLSVTEKRGGFKMWTALLAIITFSLSLLGTFIVRSGVLTSVHAFASDPTRGVFILGFLALVVGGSLFLFAWRAPRVAAMGSGGGFETVSRESMLLANNVLLIVACASVMLGTLYPLVIDALGLGKLSVGPPYFNAVFVPLMAPALFLMGIGPLARWRKAAVIDLALRLRWAAGVSVAAALLAPALLGHWTPMIGFGLLLAAWIASTAVLNLVTRLREHPAPAWSQRLRAQPGSYYGMLLAHVGVAVFITGVTVVGGFAVEKDVRMAPGDTVAIEGYVFKLEGLSERRGPNYMAVRATLSVTDNGRPIGELHPERRVYTVSRSPLTETAIDRGFTRDLYVALGDSIGADAWGMRVYYKPFVGWIWGGCVLMALGGALAVLDRRYRAARRTSTEPAHFIGHRRAARTARARDQGLVMKRYFIPLGVFVVVLGFLGIGLTLKPRELPSPLIDKPAPAFVLPTLNAPGSSLSTHDLRGQVWVLNVWASWCVACRDEHATMVEMSKLKLVPIYGLNYKDQRADAIGWLERFGNPYVASLSDTNGLVGIDYGVYGVPETFVIDKAGVIRRKFVGPVTAQTVRDEIVPLVARLNS